MINLRLLYVLIALLTGQSLRADDLTKCEHVFCENKDFSGQDLRPWTPDKLGLRMLNGSDFASSTMPTELRGHNLKGCNLASAKFGGKKGVLSGCDVDGSFINDETDFKDLSIEYVNGFDKAHYPKCGVTLRPDQFDKTDLTNAQIIAKLVAGMHACDSTITSPAQYSRRVPHAESKNPLIYHPVKDDRAYTCLADVFSRCDWTSPLAKCAQLCDEQFKSKINEPFASKSMLPNSRNDLVKVYPIHAAVDANNPEAIRWLAKSGASLNEYDGEGMTALHRANSAAAVTALANCAGIDVNKVGIGRDARLKSMKKTPIESAVINEEIGIVSALATAPNIKLDTALQIARKIENGDISLSSGPISYSQQQRREKIRQILSRATASKYGICHNTGFFCW